MANFTINVLKVCYTYMYSIHTHIHICSWEEKYKKREEGSFLKKYKSLEFHLETNDVPTFLFIYRDKVIMQKCE